MLAAIEGGRHIVTAAGLAGHPPPSDPAGFERFLSGLVAPDVTAALEGAEPLDDPVGFRFPAGVRRRYERLRHLPPGLLVVGDGVCSFNPIYGQGMTAAALQAFALRAELARHDPPRSARYFRAVARVVDAPWLLATGADLAHPGVTGRRVPAVRLFNRYLPRVHAAAAHDPVVATAVLRVTGLLDPPTALLRPDRVARVLAGGAGGSSPVPEAATGRGRALPRRPAQV